MVQAIWHVVVRLRPKNRKILTKLRKELGIYYAQSDKSTVTLVETPWRDEDDGHSDVGFRDVLRQRLQPKKDDD
jgi:hypothetical protein